MPYSSYVISDYNRQPSNGEPVRLSETYRRIQQDIDSGFTSQDSYFIQTANTFTSSFVNAITEGETSIGFQIGDGLNPNGIVSGNDNTTILSYPAKYWKDLFGKQKVGYHNQLTNINIVVRAVMPDDWVPTNVAPEFTSPQVNTATVGVPYEYTATATDQDGDGLGFQLPSDLIEWPEELIAAGYDPVAAGHLPTFEQTSFTLGDERAKLTWTPPKELAGQTVTFYEQVTDGINVTLRRIEIEIEGVNTPPVIVANPNTIYYQVENISLTSTEDPVDPGYISLELADGETQSVDVTLIQSPTEFTSEIVFVVDRSGSMGEGFNWLRDNIISLDTKLNTSGFSTRKYGLVLFDETISQVTFGGPTIKFGSADQLQSSLSISPNGNEQGNRTLSRYPSDTCEGFVVPRGPFSFFPNTSGRSVLLNQ